METKKSKVFTHKLIALFLAALLVISTFTGVMTVFARSTDDYHDANLAANFLAWAETTDNQTAEALLDYADLYLPQLMEGLDLGDIKPRGSTHLNFRYDVPVIGAISISGYLDSIDGVIQLVKDANNNVLHKGVLGRDLKAWAGGDVQNINLDSLNDLQYSTSEGVVSRCGVSFRARNDAKEIILAVAKLLYVHANNNGGNKNVLNQFVTGNLNLGLIGNFINIWDELKAPLNMWDNYQTNIVYNIVANLIWENTDWYTEAQVESFKQNFINNGKNQNAWDFDDELFGKLTSELLQRINVQVTYSNKVPEIDLDRNSQTYGTVIKNKDGEINYVKDSSKRRWFLIDSYMKQNKTYAEAVALVNANEGVQEGFWCDPNLRYDVNEDGSSDGNILLFTYGNKTLDVHKTDSANTIAFNALEIAWQTVLEPTLGLLEVDYGGKRNESAIFDQEASNFDRSYYSWKSSHGGWVTSETNENKWKENYAASSVEAWAADVYDSFTYKDGVTPSPEAFLEGVAATYDFDRTRVEDPKNNWRDIDATKLYVELRYSPLADLYFNKQTGPINLYFAETGATNLKKFFATAFNNYSSIPEGLNDALVAAVKDFFPESNNIGMTEDGAFVNLSRPELRTVSGVNSEALATTLVSNAAHMFEYAANAADENILGAFYAASAQRDPFALNNLDESNFEEAALPMLISLLNQLQIADVIHETEWDTCVDAEGVAITALAEYLSYVLPDKSYAQMYKVNTKNELVANYDVNRDGKKELFTDVIMPMARDALGYILQSVVTCRDEIGAEWSVYTSDPLTDQTSIFTILNSVLCYYASTDMFENSQGAGDSQIKGKGAAALLGCVDRNGKCTVTFRNDLWTNLDTIINTLLPVVGALQTGTYGEADSYDLIYTKIIEGVLNISNNGGGITNIIKQLIDILDSTPLKTGADVALYDYVVAPTVNAIFGGKYSGQSFQNVIPDKAEYFANDNSDNTDPASPFDSLIHVDTLGNYQSTGLLSILISNLVEAFGVNEFWNYSADRWQGAMFAVKAVNNFIPSFVPQLSDHKFGPVTAKIDISSYSGMVGNQSIQSLGSNYLRITNTALGLNRFYRPGPNQKVQREPRYFAEIKSAEITNEDGYTNIYLQGNTSGVLAPGEALKIPILGNALPREETYVYKVAVTYNMYEAELVNGNKPSSNGEYLFPTDITTYAYLVITVGGSWQSALYPDEEAEKDDSDNVIKYKYTADSRDNNTAGETYGTGDAEVVNSSVGGPSNSLIAAVPKTIVIPSEDPSIANKYSIRVYNSSNSARSYSGAVAFISEGTQYYAVNGDEVASTLSTMNNNTSSNMAYAYIDSEGNLLKRDYYDYRVKDGDTWGQWNRGYSRSQLDSMEGEGGSLYDAFNDSRVEERTHVTYTFDEALAAGIVTGVQRSASGEGYTYQNVFVNPTSTLVSDSANGITFVAPFSGFYFQNHGSRVERGESSYDLLLAYDESGVSASSEAYKLNVAFIPESGNKMIVSSDVYVADQSDLYSLTDATQTEVTKMASYRPSDFLDFNEATGTSENYNAIIDAMTEANKLAATALSVEAASKISSVKITQAATGQTTNHGGDRAYVPATENQIPANVLADAYKSGDIYYLNKELTMPIYSNVELTDSDVVGLTAGDPATGKDSAGQDVVKYGGVWYLANEIDYESEWDTTTYWVDGEIEGTKVGAPYYAPVKDDAHIIKWGDSTVYRQKQFVYRDAYGNKVNSDDRYDNGTYKWVVKFAVSETVIKPNDGNEYRGAYQQGIDTLNYYNSIFSKILKTVGAQSVADRVTAIRSVDSNNVNYDVATYEKMVQIAREAEDLIWYEDENGNYVEKDNVTENAHPVTDRSSMEIEMAVNRFETYYERAQDNTRGYIGGRLESEISDHHAIGGSYHDFIATKTGDKVRFAYSTKGEDEDDDVDVYTVKVAEGTELGFGSRAADGSLVNEDENGNKAYTDASWDAYVNALGEAVETATGQSAKVSEIYTAKSHLVMAENNLEPYTGEDSTKYTVTGKITISEDREGTSGEYGIGGISIFDAEGTELAVSEADGSFEIKLPKGESSTLTVSGETTVARTITITGDNDVANINIPIVVCNYQSADSVINLTDAGLFLDYMDTSYVYANLQAADSVVNLTDAGLFLDFMGDAPVSYANWSQSTYVFE